jgi:glycosyltransferase involved in cell wall biosynthesis
MSLILALTIISKKIIFLSLNRFDPNKKVELAVDAFAQLCARNPQKASDMQLVIAGDILYQLLLII